MHKLHPWSECATWYSHSSSVSCKVEPLPRGIAMISLYLTCDLDRGRRRYDSLSCRAGHWGVPPLCALALPAHAYLGRFLDIQFEAASSFFLLALGVCSTNIVFLIPHNLKLFTNSFQSPSLFYLLIFSPLVYLLIYNSLSRILHWRKCVCVCLDLT